MMNAAPSARAERTSATGGRNASIGDTRPAFSAGSRPATTVRPTPITTAATSKAGLTTGAPTRTCTYCS